MGQDIKLEYGMWDFLKKPTIKQPVISTLKGKLKLFISLFILEIVFTFCTGVLISGFGNSDITSGTTVNIQQYLNQFPAWFIFIALVIITPTIEELFFRLSLKLNVKTMHFNVIIIIAGIILFIMSIIKTKWIEISFITFGVIILLSYFIRKGKFNQIILAFWDKNFSYVFYFFVFSYGLLHVSNFNPKSISFLLLPIILLPQFILGLFCGYIRVKLGFNWSCFFHFLHNGIIMLPILLLSLDKIK
jgi:membrane protease YdiL (CAAX protease family)